MEDPFADEIKVANEDAAHKRASRRAGLASTLSEIVTEPAPAPVEPGLGHNDVAEVSDARSKRALKRANKKQNAQAIALRQEANAKKASDEQFLRLTRIAQDSVP